MITYAGRAVPRMGFGAMRLVGPGLTEPTDRATAHLVLRRAVELGIRIIDTAWYYGHDVSNRLIAEALRPYPDDLVLATKLGAQLTTGNRPEAAVRPEQLRAGNDRDRSVLGLDTVPLTHLRWPGGETVDGVGFDEAFDTMIALRDEGRIEHLGLSNITLDQLRRTHARHPVASVSNVYSYNNRRDQDVLDFCTAKGIAFLPYGPLDFGGPVDTEPLLVEARRRGVTPAQVMISWLLDQSPVVVPIPGTGSVEHLLENVAAAH
ncbi:aldo/keto reductase [Kutzneria sp. NPDC052558]|uniref:aldo/keto reductase n=1 Tax=Kutzneria sp. NPDC052558 TaxID=3364121 RepID=UPI0037C80281